MVTTVYEGEKGGGRVKSYHKYIILISYQYHIDIIQLKS